MGLDGTGHVGDASGSCTQRTLGPGQRGPGGRACAPASPRLRCWTFLLPRLAKRRAGRGPPAQKQRCCRLRAENQMVLGWGLGLRQKWRCLFSGELGGVPNLTLVFPCSCVLAGMARSRDPYSACSHEGANLSPDCSYYWVSFQ